MEEPMRQSRLPKTDSIQELARFWDTHDVTEFDQELEVVDEPVFERRVGITVSTGNSGCADASEHGEFTRAPGSGISSPMGA